MEWVITTFANIQMTQFWGQLPLQCTHSLQLCYRSWASHPSWEGLCFRFFYLQHFKINNEERKKISRMYYHKWIQRHFRHETKYILYTKFSIWNLPSLSLWITKGLVFRQRWVLMPLKPMKWYLYCIPRALCHNLQIDFINGFDVSVSPWNYICVAFHKISEQRSQSGSLNFKFTDKSISIPILWPWSSSYRNLVYSMVRGFKNNK